MKQTFKIDDVISSLQALKKQGFDICHIDILSNIPFYDSETYKGWTQSELLIKGVDTRDTSYNDIKYIYSLDKKFV